MKKHCKDCEKKLQHNNKTGYCFICEEKYHICKICGVKISLCSWRRTKLCHLCGVKNNKIGTKKCECGRTLHPNSKDTRCRECQLKACICKKCGKKISLTGYRASGLCHGCKIKEVIAKRRLPDEFCIVCGIKLKTRNRSKLKNCEICCDKKHMTGYFDSLKNGKKIYYQSSYELRAIEFFESNIEIKSFDRAALKIKYSLNNKERNYIPDFIVFYMNGKLECIEIKPYRQTVGEDEWSIMNKAKFEAASRHFGNNIVFKILTEKDLFQKEII